MPLLSDLSDYYGTDPNQLGYVYADPAATSGSGYPSTDPGFLGPTYPTTPTYPAPSPPGYGGGPSMTPMPTQPTNPYADWPMPSQPTTTSGGYTPQGGGYWPSDGTYTPIPSSGSPSPTSSGGSLDSQIQSILNQYLSGTLTPAGLNAANQALNALGVKQEKDSAGNVRGRLYLPDGRTVDLGNFGGPMQWVDRGLNWGQGDGAPSGSGSGGGGSANQYGGNSSIPGWGSLAQTYDKTFSYSPYGQTFSYQPFTDQFHGPTLEELRATPGYQFALEQGLQGIQRSAASKGTLLTGGTLKALDQYGTGLADQTYASAYNRAWQEYMGKFGINASNQSGLERAFMDNFNVNSSNQLGLERAFLDNYNIWRNNGNDQFGRFYNLANLGLNASSF